MTAMEMETEMASRLDTGRMAKAIADGRKDELLIDCARLVAVHYGKMVERFSALEGRPVSAHNNKTLFLEGIDLWCRKVFFGQAPQGPETDDPREVVAWWMGPFYEALELHDPAEYRVRRAGHAPVFVGRPEDAQCVMLALCASVEVAPIRIRLGLKDGRPERAWGFVHADRNWYDTDISVPSFVLGDHMEFPEYQEVEVPL